MLSDLLALHRKGAKCAKVFKGDKRIFFADLAPLRFEQMKDHAREREWNSDGTDSMGSGGWVGMIEKGLASKGGDPFKALFGDSLSVQRLEQNY